MNKIILAFSLLALSATVSCKKDDKKTSIGGNTWTLDGKTYTSASTGKNDSAYSFVSTSLEQVSFYFKTYPTKSGTYHINDDIDLADDEVDILVGTFSPVLVGDARDPTSTISVTVSDGKINFKCSGIPIHEEDGSGVVLGTGTLSTDLTTNQ